MIWAKAWATAPLIASSADADRHHLETSWLLRLNASTRRKSFSITAKKTGNAVITAPIQIRYSVPANPGKRINRQFCRECRQHHRADDRGFRMKASCNQPLRNGKAALIPKAMKISHVPVDPSVMASNAQLAPDSRQ